MTLSDQMPGRRRRRLAAGVAGSLGALLLAAAVPPAGAAVEDPPFRDPALPLEERVEDLVSRLTLEEKVSLMHQWQPEIERLGLPAFRTGTEALHGVAWLGEATVFPQAIGLGSTWDTELLGRVGEVVGTEARGFHHLDPDYHGLNLWAPVVDLLRDPRAGRNEEGYSEDALHTGRMSTAYASGIQGDDVTYLRAAPMLKHFIGYNNEAERDRTNSSLPPRTLHEYWLPAFEEALSAGAANGMMASYNLVNGRPAHLSPLIEHARTWSEEELLVVSDAYAPGNVVDAQGYYDTHPESHAALVRAGVDSFTDRGEDPSFTVGHLTDALAQGLLTEEDLDDALRHMLPVRFRLGDFDPPGLNPYEDITDDVINAPEHQELAHEAALAQMVLLENDADLLPLDDAGSVAVVGPLSDTLYEDWYSGTMPYRVTALDGLTERLGADSVTTSEGVDSVALRVAATGAYLTAPSDADGGQLTAGPDTAGPAETMALFDWGQGVYALRTEANGKYLSRGWDDVVRNDQHQPNGWEVRETFNLEEAEDGSVIVRNVQNRRYLSVGADGGVTAAADAAGATRFVLETLTEGTEEAVAAAAAADTAVVVVGNNPYINGRETQDRADLALSPAQQELVAAVTEANEDVVVVLMTSYPVTLPQDLTTVLWTSHAGQETGTALADVLLGDVSPAGRLTQTWYRTVDDLPESILEYDISQAGTTYQHFTGEPLYPFGHGLTYTQFEYSDVRIPAQAAAEVAPDGTVEVSVDVTNTGERDSDEVVQLYTRTLDAPVDQPLQTLRDFARVHVPAGETRTVTFSLPVADLAYWDVETDAEVVAPGRYDVLVGPSSQDVRSSTQVVVGGEAVPRERDLTDGEDAVDFDSYEGVEVVDRSRTAGDSAGVGAGDWLAFHDVRFSPAQERSFEASVAREAAGPGAVEVRLGAPDGELLATLDVPSTGDRYAYETVSAPLADLEAGVHDLYLVAADDARLATVRLVETPLAAPAPGPTTPGEPGDPTAGPTDDPTAAPAPTGPAADRLPTTGVDGGPLLAALGLLVAGGLTLALRRRLGGGAA
ncbi:carbohydrate-binding protein [Georgenia wutianyii]|uniref:Carbohydrate-binding protein n=1 Tax=Georgenia wutianyii TaxID=2585135 RepID=A0ABX5VMB3_9MICO|nr:glycoside hydrolase family 3 protein [Georgenia wutianyii]QDB79636.1 carbohydrate-binding protein [Georgenia wutianyii]